MVATDDERIRQAVEDFGGKAVMTRTDHPSGTDRIAEAAGDGDADIVVNIQGDEPLIDPGLIDSLVETMASDVALEMATAASVIETDADLHDPSVVKVVRNRDENALFFSRSVIPCDREGTYDLGSGDYLRHIGLYAYRSEFLKKFVATPPCAVEELEKLEQLRALHIGATIRVVKTATSAAGVDVPADVERVEEALKALGM
jgi:3-deoxy-manno-octulosonate cytidylyltransferase (CMP-KDO synthetase)